MRNLFIWIFKSEIQHGAICEREEKQAASFSPLQKL